MQAIYLNILNVSSITDISFNMFKTNPGLNPNLKSTALVI